MFRAYGMNSFTISLNCYQWAIQCHPKTLLEWKYCSPGGPGGSGTQISTGDRYFLKLWSDTRRRISLKLSKFLKSNPKFLHYLFYVNFLERLHCNPSALKYSGNRRDGYTTNNLLQILAFSPPCGAGSRQLRGPALFFWFLGYILRQIDAKTESKGPI